MSHSADDAKRVTRRFPEDVATDGDIDALDEIITHDFVDHNTLGLDMSGRESAKDDIQLLREAFPDFEARVEDIIAEGDTTAMRVTLSGTHEGEFMGIEPTGNHFEIQNLVFSRLEDGKIAERWVQPDTLGMLQQLDVVPDDPSRMAPSADD